MDWHHIAKGLKHLIVTVASPRNIVQEGSTPRPIIQAVPLSPAAKGTTTRV